jgi:hypothetical protein
MFVIYFDPEDAPGEVIMRRWTWDGQRYVTTDDAIKVSTQDTISHWTHEEYLNWRIEWARNEIKRRSPASIRIPRSADDEPQIVEFWA